MFGKGDLCCLLDANNSIPSDEKETCISTLELKKDKNYIPRISFSFILPVPRREVRL